MDCGRGLEWASVPRMVQPKKPAPRSANAEQRRLLMAPLALFLATLLVIWTMTVYAMRSMEGIDPSLRQFAPILLWAIAIILWLRWQRISHPRRWLGLILPSAKTFGVALAAFAIVVAWNLIRVGLARAPGGLLAELPWEIYLWLALGVFMNEVLLRGVVLTRLSEFYDPAIAIPVTAVIGVLFRIPAFFTTTVPMPFDPMVLFAVLIFGCIAGLLRHFTGSLWPALALQWGNSLGQLL